MSKPKNKQESSIERDVVNAREIDECACGFEDPECLFCDEPATNCIARGAGHICDECFRRLDESGLTIVLEK